MKKWLKRLFFTLLSVVLLLGGSLWALLFTETGLRQVPRVVGWFTPYQLSAQAWRGSLLGGLTLEQLQFIGEGIDLKLETFTLKLNPKALWNKHLHLQTLQLAHGELHLPASQNQDHDPPSEPLRALPEIRLPILIDVDEISVDDFKISQQKQPIIHLNDLRLNAQFHDHKLTLQSALHSDLLDLEHLKLQLETVRDYPLQLELNALWHQPSQNLASQNLDLHLAGSALQPKLQLSTTGETINFDAQAQAHIDLAAQSLNAELTWQDLSALGGEYQSPRGQLHAGGAFDALQLELDTEATGSPIPPLKLNAKALLQPETIDHIAVQLHALDGIAQLTGKVNLAHLSWDNTLKLEKINPKFFGVRGELNTELHSQGAWHDTQQSALVEIVALEGTLEDYPLRGSGNLRYENNLLHADHLDLRLADNQLTANGTFSPEQADLSAEINAPSLQHVLPELRGALRGKIALTGDPSDPELHADLTWQKLQYAQLFESQQGQLQSHGKLNALQLNAQLDGKGQDIPPFKAELSALLEEFSALNQLQLKLNALDGTAELRGDVELNPVAWDIILTTDKLNPKALLPELSAMLNSELHSRGQLEPTLDINLFIKALSGSWQKQALAGSGTVRLVQDNITLDQLQINVGNNQLSADGNITPSALALKLKLDAKQLQAFYPKLAGALQLDGEVSGKPELPTIELNATGKQLTFDDIKLAQLNAKIHSHPQNNGVFNNQITLNGVKLADQSWQSIELNTRGTFNQHELKLDTTGGESNVHTRLRGGFKSFSEYLGEIQALQLQHQDIKLSMPRPAQLHYQPKGLKLSNFCLVDQHSDVCVDVEQNQNKALFVKYQLKALDPKSLAAFIPDNVKVQTVVRGQGEIRQNERGALTGTSQLQLDNGQITVRIPDQPPLNIPITQNSGFKAQLNGQNVQSALRLNLGHIGQVEGDFGLNDFKRMSGQVKINLPDLGVFRHFAPKISTLQGKVQGQMSIGGTVQQPEFHGQIQLQNGLVTLPAYATELKDISLQLLAQKTGQIDIQGHIGTPDGNLKTQGVLHLSPLKLNLQLAGKDMLVANAKTMKVSVDPKFDIQIDPNKGINVQGEIIIPKANISVPDTSSGVSASNDVVIVGSQAPKKKATAAESNSPFRADIALKLGNAVFFRNSDMNIRLKGGINVKMRPQEALSATGKIEVASGVYMLYGQELDIRRGSVSFTGNIANPVVDVLALRQIDDVEVGASVKGAVSRLKLSLTSNPAMPDSSIVSYLMFGRPPDGAMDKNGLMNAAANMALGSVMPDLAESTGLDVLDINLSGLKAGKNLTEDLYVGLKSDFFTSITEFIAKYHFNKRMRVEASASQNNKQVEFIYEYEKD